MFKWIHWAMIHKETETMGLLDFTPEAEIVWCAMWICS